MNGNRPVQRSAAIALAPSSLALIGAATLATALLGGAAAGPARAIDQPVSIVDFSFEPPTVTVDAGDTVTWTVTRAKDPHTVSPVDPADAFEGSALLRQGDSFAVTFAQPGTYRYECMIHPEQMQGTVIVLAAGSRSSPTTNSAATPPAATTGLPSPGEIPTPTLSGASDGPAGGGSPPTVVLVAVLAAAGLAGWFLVRRRKGR